jgi:hypothetical protein
MGLIGRIIDALFGESRNVLKETAEVFRVNAEAEAARGADAQAAALAQFAAEFAHPRRGAFDRLVDGLNRLPRPAMALGTLALFAAAMAAPLWFAERMRALAAVPEPLWWLLGAVVSFYFGARHQAKGQEFQRALAAGLLRAAPRARQAAAEARAASNPALDDWRAGHARPATR